MREAIPRLMVVIRVFLALVFLVYGGAKLAGGQFYYGDWATSKSTVGGPSLVWLFYGYSPLYGRFLGLFEFVPAILLLFPRTATAAAAALFAVSLNITVLDFAFGFPAVKYASAFYTVLCGVLMAYDSRKLRLLLASRDETDAAYDAAARVRTMPRERAKRWSKRRLILATPIVAAGLIFIVDAALMSRDLGPMQEARAALVARGFEDREVKLIGMRLSGSFISRAAVAEFQVPTASPPRSFRVDAVRPNNFVSWRIVKVVEGHLDTTNSK